MTLIEMYLAGLVTSAGIATTMLVFLIFLNMLNMHFRAIALKQKQAMVKDMLKLQGKSGKPPLPGFEGLGQGQK